MPASTQFITSIQTLLLLAAKPDELHRSADVARCLGTNPVVIRRIFLRLGEAEIICSRKGPGGGAKLARKPEEITLRDVYRAVPSSGPRLPGGKLKAILSSASRAFDDELAQTTLAKLVKGPARVPKP